MAELVLIVDDNERNAKLARDVLEARRDAHAVGRDRGGGPRARA